MYKQYTSIIVSFLLILFSISCSKEETYIPINDVLPIATEDVITSTLTSTVEIPVLTNDIKGDAIVPTSLNIIEGTDTDANGTLDTFTKTGEGTWRTTSNGIITFDPAIGFTGNPTPIKYTGKDLEKNTSNEATVVIDNITFKGYAKLSDYKFFIGDLKDQTPTLNVIPYEPASGLFTDYASKKRFIWIPKNLKATYDTDNKVFDFPIGTVLIKSFYYTTIQPDNSTKIIETRLMIKKSEGWIFAEYIWNEAQTEATLLVGNDFVNGSSKNITFKKPNNTDITIDYRIPSKSECIACHKINEIPTPIGLKPQNLNHNYTYTEGSKNQLQKLLEQGYINSYPDVINSTVDYHDTSKSLDLRARSYLDANCAHCHQFQGRCGYTTLRFGFGESLNPTNLGVCVNALEPISTSLTKIVNPGNFYKSIMHYRLNSVIENKRMPLLGRTIIHDEGIQLIEDWISSLTEPCN
jgi:uncharacterized repeat protein (TIGR03806 family)